jgi:hypothetical protein
MYGKVLVPDNLTPKGTLVKDVVLYAISMLRYLMGHCGAG